MLTMLLKLRSRTHIASHQPKRPTFRPPWWHLFRPQCRAFRWVVVRRLLREGTAFRRPPSGRRTGAQLGRLHDGWHHLAAVGGNGAQRFFIDGEFVGSVGQQIQSDITGIGNKPSGTQPWGGFNSFVIYSTQLSDADIAATGSTHQTRGSGLLFSETAMGLVSGITSSYGRTGELSVEFWIRKPATFAAQNNFQRQMVLSAVDQAPAAVRSGKGETVG